MAIHYQHILNKQDRIDGGRIAEAIQIGVRKIAALPVLACIRREALQDIEQTIYEELDGLDDDND